MKPATQKRLFAWCVTATVGAGLLSFYYYLSLGTVHTLAFGQAFATFIVLTLVSLLVALQPGREAPLASPIASAPAPPPAAPVQPAEAPSDPAPRLQAQSEYQSAQSRVLRSAYRVGNQEVTTYDVHTSVGTVPFELIERTLEQVEVASEPGDQDAAVPMSAPSGNGSTESPEGRDATPSGATRIREARDRLQQLVPPVESGAGLPPPAMVGEQPASGNGDAGPPGMDARHWKLRYEAERDALVKLWMLYQDAEAELRNLRDRPDSTGPPRAPAPNPDGLPPTAQP